MILLIKKYFLLINFFNNKEIQKNLKNKKPFSKHPLFDFFFLSPNDTA